VIIKNSDKERADRIFANPFYQSLSSSLAGTQEYMAMEKLGQLKATGRWELVVVDTPPTRSALDFLDAPKRLSAFLDGRLLRILIGSARVGGRAYVKVLSAGVGLVTGVLSKLLGTQLLTDLGTFVTALDTMFGGFRERADHTYRLLQDPGTAFVVVAAPERDALREASYFVERLEAESMPLAGVVINRMHRTLAPQLGRERSVAAAEALDESGESELTVGVLRLHADRVALATRERAMRDRFVSAHPTVRLVEASALPDDVHDLDGLRDVGADLASGAAGAERSA
jgi:anion-transporting  ArsA/GET3 family ATPase